MFSNCSYVWTAEKAGTVLGVVCTATWLSLPAGGRARGSTAD